MGRLWTDHNEPDLAEVFADPIIQQRMASAHLSREDMTRSIEAVRPALLRARTLPGRGEAERALTN